ncbi:LbetaH domain-containing protein [Galbibacter mesophilus]|uniref:acetyltransferase n=1 Tax=Galbibacter mesophilus TaxID=379069 RepID=UPI00191DB8B5|nr:acetyltransferase [Galbibacter mesophilus]MCM5663486.1 acetyltransferase [Galbibacter mesophilus]
MREIKRLIRNYYFLDLLRLFRDIILTKIFFPKEVRIIKQPSHIIGKNNILFGKNFSSGSNLRIEVLGKEFVRHHISGFNEIPKLIIGNNISCNNNVHIGVIKKISLGNNVLIGSNVLIIDHNHGCYNGFIQDSPSTPPKDRVAVPREIFIGNNVWIGENVSILAGSRIGDGCIIGANTVINSVFGSNLIIIGSPARAVKKYNEQTKSWEKISKNF